MRQPQELGNPTTRNGIIYTDEEVEFLIAIDRYKRQNHRPFPTWREVLRVFESLGYRKVAETAALPVFEKHPSGGGNHGQKQY